MLMDIRIDNSMRDSSADRVYEVAAELFALLSTPTRLRLLYELRQGEKNVSELLERVDVSQPNASQHLGLLYRSGVVARRRVGTQVYYRIVSERARLLCEVVASECSGAMLRSRAVSVAPAARV